MLGIAVACQVPLATPTSGPGPKGRLTIGIPDQPQSLNPYHTGFATSSAPQRRPIFDNLTDIDSSGKVIPNLAASWRNTSPTTWEIKLRAGVKFQNGEPVDMDSVEYSFVQALDPKNGSTAGRLATFARVEPIDRETFRITTKCLYPLRFKRTMPGTLSDFSAE